MNQLTFHPFKKIGKRLKRERRKRLLDIFEGPRGKNFSLKDPASSTACDENEEIFLFLKAMEGVRPIRKRRHFQKEGGQQDLFQGSKETHHDCLDLNKGIREEEKVLECLKGLISGKTAFHVSDTPEYVSGGRSAFSRTIADALHKGRFSVQAYLDLHGLDEVMALSMCEEFVKDAMEKGARCIAFIHGRGLGSRKDPVLKKAVLGWLRRGPYRRFVVAYASAPPWDGGTGVTYALLKRSPYKRVKGHVDKT